jgi:hypothetical protein
MKICPGILPMGNIPNAFWTQTSPENQVANIFPPK